MRSVFILSALAISILASPSARAEKFDCGFTEPFLTVTYDTATQVLVIKDEVMNTVRTQRAISFSVAGPGIFLLRDSKGTEVARLELTHEGSDGMSETVYPYSVTYGSWTGGCESSLFRAKTQD